MDFCPAPTEAEAFQWFLKVTEVYLIIIGFTKLRVLGAGMLREKMTSPKAALLAGAFLKA